MRLILPALCLVLLVGCTSGPDPSKGASDGSRHSRNVLGTTMSLDVRYRAGETLSLETRIKLVCGRELISTPLKDCDVRPVRDATIFTTGGIVRPGSACHILVLQPGEPAQVFPLPEIHRNDRLNVWSDWISPVGQIVSPMPAQTLIHQPKSMAPLSIPQGRQFEIRYQLNAFTPTVPTGY